jgi:acetyl/propionyl-CoA carboxylase alpha subunit
MSAQTTTIRRVLVANRGEIAVRIFATCRRLGIATVAVHSTADAEAPFVRAADAAVLIGGPEPSASYLRGDAVIEAARAAGADAVHPGYGFLSESADFAAAVLDAGLIWIGPAPETIEAMGSKVRAREAMEEAGVPVLPGARLGDAVVDEQLRRQAAAIGYPLLVKASAGGGGRGMRRVDDPDGLSSAVASARHEAGAAFGDPTVFLERLVLRPRHVEVQILGDAHGTISVLPERDCTIQRRHQKLVEESPAPNLDATVRAAMADAARSAAEAISYVGAGTVEFVLDPEGGAYFLEVNTRLQVEHPVTEAVCGLDLVELQLRIAEGEALPPEAIDPGPVGHAIEARLVAEDPAADWMPQTGPVHRFAFPDDVRVDSGVESGSVVSPYYDSLLAKVVVHAPTREAAARRLADALRRADLAGPMTARDLLVHVLEHPRFLAVDHDTQFVEDAIGDLARPLLAADERPRAVAAAALAIQAARRDAVPAGRLVPSGWRNVPELPQRCSFGGATDPVDVAYRLDRSGALATLQVDGVDLAVELQAATAELVELRIAGVRRRYAVRTAGDRVWVSTPRGQLELRVRSRFPDTADAAPEGTSTAPLPGTVLRVLVEVGDRVEAGQAVVVVEAMKMEHEITTATSGTVGALPVAVGDRVAEGAVLIVVDD